ncbi:hypothetical protein [Eoetvoesiella caeni]|uniref:Uncharacterized protein n=1 Tax=Eoetvoesiella caeni TaxID=645616 RepID=A0A366HC68_9BURK|nr:hypothetical protein [Eoetvoesiella caeni]MCI2809545.1 hypothetical protein [Eoetvoesiella caeni]NYT56041.1 hypothetical protein [Eoetvoesiella caeni]RBP38805.1 hypothetical protein DFR37_10697 [Eoetvoesiella caeni]
MAIQEFIVSSAPVRPNVAVQPFPLVEQAARHAADLWWQTAPLTMAAWRDNRFDALQSGLGFDAEALHARKRTFDIAFARRIGEVIAGAAGRV